MKIKSILKTMLAVLFTAPAFACDLTLTQSGTIDDLQHAVDSANGGKLCLARGTEFVTATYNMYGANALEILSDAEIEALPGDGPAPLIENKINSNYSWSRAVRILGGELKVKGVNFKAKSVAIDVRAGSLDLDRSSIETTLPSSSAIYFGEDTATEARISRSSMKCKGIGAQCIRAIVGHVNLVIDRTTITVTHRDSTGLSMRTEGNMDVKGLLVNTEAEWSTAIALGRESVSTMRRLLLKLDQNFSRGVATVDQATLTNLASVKVMMSGAGSMALTHSSTTPIAQVQNLIVEAGDDADGSIGVWVDPTMYPYPFNQPKIIESISGFRFDFLTAHATAFSLNPLPGGAASGDFSFIYDLSDGEVNHPVLSFFTMYDAPERVINIQNVTENTF